MNGSNVQAKKPICKCLLVAAAVVCVCVCARSHEHVCVHPSGLCCVTFVSTCVFLLVTAIQADAVRTPHLSSLSVTFSCQTLQIPYCIRHTLHGKYLPEISHF